jgi:hypothetical protein
MAEQGAKRRAQTIESMPLRRRGANGAEFWTLAPTATVTAWILGSVYIQDSQFGESLIQAAGWMEVSMDGPTGTE